MRRTIVMNCIKFTRFCKRCVFKNSKDKIKKKNRLKSFTRDKTSKHDVRISQPVLHVSWQLLRLIYMLSNSLQCETLEMVILATAERTFVMFTGDLVFLRQDVLTFNLLVISSCSKYLEICIKSYNKKKIPLPKMEHLFHRQPKKIRNI